MPSAIELLATILFAVAIIHTFAVSFFARLAHRGGDHAAVWHVLSEVEVVFGVWAFVLIVCMALLRGKESALQYMETRNFTEPLFVFTIMVVAGSRPILELVSRLIRGLAHLFPMERDVTTFFVVLFFVPLCGSFITEPAAMTLAAILLRDAYFRRPGRVAFKYMTMGVLFVNVSIGGVLTPYAAPPVLMVATAFGWDTTFLITHFGWRAMVAVALNASVLTFFYRKELAAGIIGTGTGVDAPNEATVQRPGVPTAIMGIHLAFLVAVVLTAHYPTIFLGLLMMFIGFAEAYRRYQHRLMIKEGLMVGFFLAGLVVLGGLQKWWLQNLLGELPPFVLFWGTTVLTAIMDNAALTYLGSMVEGTHETWRYMLVAGAVTGGGLTVIANAPNPAGFAILKKYFPDENIAAGPLLLAALAPTLVAAVMFLV